MRGGKGLALAIAALVAALPGPLRGQARAATEPGGEAVARGSATVRSVGLAEAIDAALEGNPGLRIAREREGAARAGARAAAGALWPEVGVEAGALRSVDPVVAFGTKLRQARFGQDDLALDALNDPDPLSDWFGSVGVRWGILDPGRWAGTAAAGRRADAAGWRGERTRQATVFRTKLLYYDAIRADALLTSAREAEEAARSTAELFRRRRAEGLLTGADVLQAEAELRAATARTLDARRVRAEAREALGLHLGWGADSVPTPADSLGGPGVEASPVGASFEPRARPDLRALDAAAGAAGAEERRALAAYFPGVELFGSWVTHAGDPFESDATDWTVGLTLRWALFTGLGRDARVDAARAERRIVETEYERALREARVEVQRARRAVASARAGLEATEAAAEAALEGARLTRLRFREEMATATDVLEAESRATSMRSRAIEARVRYHAAVARLEFVRPESATAQGEDTER